MAKKKQTVEETVQEPAANPNIIWVVSVALFGSWSDMTTGQMATNNNPAQVDKSKKNVHLALLHKAIKEISAEKAAQMKADLVAIKEEKAQKVAAKETKTSEFEEAKKPETKVDVPVTEETEPVKSEDLPNEAV